MRKLFFAMLFFLFFTSYGFAATLVWDFDEYHDKSVGYTVYFTDGEENFNYSFTVDQTEVVVVDGQQVHFDNVENRLNLHYGVEYELYLTRYNDMGESDPSNTITYTRPAYSPPTNHLPSDPDVSLELSLVGDLRVR